MAGLRLIDHFEAAAPLCHDDAALAALIGDATRELGFQFFAVLHHSCLNVPDRRLVRLDSYPESWSEEYVAADFPSLDPVHYACLRTSIGFAWAQLPDIISIDDAGGRVLARSRRHGLGDGFTVPISIPGEPLASCSFATRLGVELPVERLLSAEQLGAHAFHAARRLRGLPAPGRRPRLSRRERQCLRLLTAGKTDWEIAVILGVSTETARQYVKLARALYGVVSRAQLVACGLRDAFVTFEDAIPPNGGMDQG